LFFILKKFKIIYYQIFLRIALDWLLIGFWVLHQVGFVVSLNWLPNNCSPF